VLEISVEDYLIERIEELDGLCLKFTVPGRRGPPDRLILLEFLDPFMVETKRPGKDAEENQKREHARYSTRRMPVYVLDTKDAVKEHCDMLRGLRNLWIQNKFR
jgi:hypothetical protein